MQTILKCLKKMLEELKHKEKIKIFDIASDLVLICSFLRGHKIVLYKLVYTMKLLQELIFRPICWHSFMGYMLDFLHLKSTFT